MSERRGLIVWPSDDICEIVAEKKPSKNYIDEQFFKMAVHNFAISVGLEESSSIFRKAYDDFCGEMFTFAGVQVYNLLDLAAQHAKNPLPVSTKSIADVIRRSLEKQTSYVKDTYNRLREDNPPISGHLHDLCKTRPIIKHGAAAIQAVVSGGIFVYSMLELQAEADKMAREFL